MIIDRLILNNFKSQSGEQVIGPFDSHFSCIIGPNGNGKSNVIDALLFVFGFKSSKLRQDKLASLIHYSAYSKPQFCKVDVIFIDGQERIKVGRSVNQNGNSYYFLNDIKKSYGQVKNFLMNKNLDLQKKLFIILQGQVEKLCQLDAQNLIQHLEYIAGSDQYKPLIEAKQALFIENGVKKQELYHLVSLKKKQFQKNEKQCLEMTALLMVKIRIAEIQFLISKKALSNLDEKILTLNQKQQEFIRKLQQLQQQEIIRKDKIKKINDERSVMQFQYLAHSKSIASQEDKIKQISRQISQLERTKMYKKKDGELYKQQISNMQAKIKQLKQLKQKQNTINYQYLQVKSVVCQLGNQLIEQFEQIIKLQTQEENLINNLMQSESLVKQLRYYIQKISLEIQAINKSKCQDNLIVLKHEIRVLNEEIYKLEKQIGKQQQQLELLKEKKSILSNQTVKTNKQDNIVKQLLSAANQNYLEGILGVLRNFVIIQQQYESIIATAVPQLNFILVDTFSNAMRGIKYLNQNKLGKCTFIVVDYIKSLKVNYKAVFNAPNGTRRIYDVCKVIKPQLQEIFYWCVGNMLIADNLDAAMKVAYGKIQYRVITLNYQFIDISGAMTKLIPKSVKTDSVQHFKKIQESTIKKLIKLKQERQNKEGQKISKMKSIEAIQTANTKNVLLNLLQNLTNIKQQEQMETKKVNLFRQKFQTNKFQILRCKAKIEEKMKCKTEDKQILNIRTNVEKYVKMKQQIRQLNSSQNVTIAMQKKISTKIQQYQYILKDIFNIEEHIQNEQNKIVKLQSGIKKYRNQIREIEEKLELLQQKQFIIGTTIGSTHELQISQSLKKIRQQLRINHEEKNKHIKLFEDSQEQMCELNNVLEKQVHYQLKDKIQKKPIFMQGQKSLFFKDFSNHLLDTIQQHKLKNVYAVAKQQMELLAKSTQIDPDTFNEFIRIKNDYEEKKNMLNELDSKQIQLRKELVALRTKRTDIFMKFFTSINIYMNNIYFQLTGGNAEIMLIDSLNPFQGAQFMVRPANKSWKTVNLLSGGQKTMTSLSLIFACQKIRKFPFYIMDEIDAALDYRNTSSLAKYISQKCDVQHIVVSLRKNMYQQSKSLIGIYKVKEMTNSIRVSMKELKQ